MDVSVEVSLADAELARRVGVGDGPAEEELCRRFRPRVRLYGLRHLRDEAAASDLAQDVLLVVVHRVRSGGLHDPERLASFVLGTCRRVAARLVRDELRRASPIATPADAHALPAEPLPRDQLARCLQALGSRERAVVLATFYAEQSTEEIAREHSLSTGNVRVIRHRALARLRSCMGIEEAA